MQDGQGQTTATYDPATGLPSKTIADDGVTTAATYVGATPTGLSWSGPVTGSVTETLDTEGRVASVASAGAAPVSYTRDAAGLLTGAGDVAVTRGPTTGEITSETLGTAKTTATYDADGRIATLTTTAGGSAVLTLRYAYDPQGRLTSLTRTAAGGAATVTTYAYDPEARLAQVTQDGKIVERDTYDASGNRIAVAGGTGTLAATYDDRDRLVSWGGETYEYAATGQLSAVTIAGATTRYSYDDLGALRTVAEPGGKTITYLVDAAGRRVGKEVGGQLVTGYLYQPDGRLAAMTDGSGAVVMSFAYDDAGHLAEVREGGASLLVVTDRLGSPVALVDGATGKAMETIAYDAWGRVTADTGPSTLPIGFAGGLRDPDTSLVRFGARDYDTTAGRWTGPDPILYAAGDTNLYRYAGGDPVNATDPSGLMPWLPPTEAGFVGDGSSVMGPLTSTWADLPSANPGTAPSSTPPTSAGGTPSSGPSPETSCVGLLCSPSGGQTCIGCGSITDQVVGLCTGLGCYAPGAGLCIGCSQLQQPGKVGCVGLACGAPGGFCVLGTCTQSPDGKNFFCLALFCGSPNGQCLGIYCSFGDPHLSSADARHFNFQAAGEFLALTSLDRRIVIQDRMEPIPGTTSVTQNTAVAASVDGDRVAVYANDARPLVVNGVVETRSDLSMRLPYGGIVERHGAIVTVTWLDGSRLSIVRRGHLDVGFSPAPGVGATLTGLLGSADGNPANDFTTRTGVVLDPNDPAFATKLYSVFGNSWRISQAESLFDYLPGQSTATFTDLSIPTAPATVAGLSDAARTQAAATCAALGVRVQPALDDCLLDVGLSGDPTYAASAAAFQAGMAGVPAARSTAPSPGGSAPPTVAPSPIQNNGGPSRSARPSPVRSPTRRSPTTTRSPRPQARSSTSPAAAPAPTA